MASAAGTSSKVARVDVGVEFLLDIVAREGGLPVQGRDLEEPRHGPARYQAEDVAQVCPRLDAVHLTARQQRDEDGVDPAPSDASYLELALRGAHPLASLDTDLNKAARRAGVKRFAQ